MRSIIGWGLPTARGAANVINLNCAIILFTVCRNLISVCRTSFLSKFIPFDKNITFHIVIAWSIVFWTFVHCIGHYFNYLYVAQALQGRWTPEQLTWLSGPGLTGQIISVAFFLLVTSAMENVRRKYFEIFWFTHHLFIVFFGGLLIHGAFCFIKSDPGPGVDPCRGGPIFWRWWLASAIVFVVERIFREVRGRKKTYISKVIQHPSKTVEIQIRKPSCKTEAGQYVFICCPEIETFEWHPFTLTSSPHEEFISLHIRVVGDWTTKFAQRLGCRFGGKDEANLGPVESSLPFIMIDGPYGSASEDVFDYDVSVLVGAGIGVTPFASILKTVWYRLNQPEGLKRLKKVYFIWTARDQYVSRRSSNRRKKKRVTHEFFPFQSFEWFQDLLHTIEEDMFNSKEYSNFLTISTYLTSKLTLDNTHNIFLQEADEENAVDAVTGLRSRTYYGRPNLDDIFSKLRARHRGTDVGVFYCGPKALSKMLHIACNKWTESTGGGTRFFYGKENF